MNTDTPAINNLFKVIDRQHPSIVTKDKFQGTLVQCRNYVDAQYRWHGNLKELESAKGGNVAAYFYNLKGLEVTIIKI